MASRVAALLVVFFVAAGAGSGCTCGTVTVHEPAEDGGGPAPDGGGPPDRTDAGDADAGPSCGGVRCAADQVCRFETCIDAPAACTFDGDCQSDTYCEAGECIPYGVGPRGESNAMCKRLTVLGLFNPKVQCEWTAPPSGDPFPDHANVLSTPLVADFDFDGNKAAVHPSIVFVTYNCNDGSCGAQPGCYGVVRVLDGATCAPQHSFGAPGEIIGSVTPAIGDVDGDGRPDIVTERQSGGVVGYRFDPTANQFVHLWNSFSSFNAGGCHWAGVSLADLDDDGKPEVVQNGPFPAAYDQSGVLIDGAAVGVTYGQMLHPVLADVDGDAQVELLDGRDVWRFDRSSRTWVIATAGGQPLGHPALADFGTWDAAGQGTRTPLDGIPELVVVTSGSVRLQTLGGAVIFGPLPLPGGGSGGPPTVADFDGDGRAEIGVAAATRYTVFDPDCAQGASSAECVSGAADGMLWSRVSQDQSSNVTGSSVYDFEADGKAELVYADECYSRVYDGRTGDVLFSQHHTSCTWYENPIVADVDGDFRSEIVIPSNVNCSVTCPAIDPIHDGVRCETDADCPGATSCAKELAGAPVGFCRCQVEADCGSPDLTCTDPLAGASPVGKVCRAQHPAGAPKQGIQVMADVLDRWVGSRTIWNQHAYSVTNVNDDGTIPRTSMVKPNWKEPGLNNFRQNVQGSQAPEAVPDLTGANVGEVMCVNDVPVLEARVCNRGTGAVASGVPVTFYDGVGKTGVVACTAVTTKVLQPGQCETVSCTWQTPAAAAGTVTISADDDGTGAGASSECEEQNNLGTLKYKPCGSIG